MRSDSFNSTKREALKAVKDALENLNLELAEADEQNGFVKANYSGNFFSWGNTISIEIGSNANQKTEIKISSTSNFQLVGWGVNDTLEEKILDEVTKILKPQ